MDQNNGGSVGHIENHSSAIAEAMQNHFGVPVSVSKSKTPYGESHYVKPQFDLPKGETPFNIRVSDHGAWVPRLHKIEHQVYPKKGDNPEKFVDESIDAAKKYGQRVGLFPKDEFVPLKGEVYHPTFGKGTIVDSQPDSAKVDFGDKGVKNISSRFLQEVPHKDNGGSVIDPDTDVPPPPGESPIPEGNVRLYHQTAASNIPSILKNGITFENAKGIEGPKAIYADEKGFYGKPGKVPTIEFSIPKERWTHPPFVLGDVKPSEIVAAHLPWHETVRYLEEFPDQIKRTLQGEHDNLMDGSGSNEDKAVRYIKQKYKPHKDNGGGITDNGSNAYEDAIKKALQNYDHVGLRTVEKPIKGPLKNSSVWNDGKPSNKKLNGVSATDVNDKTSRIEHGLTKESGSYHGPYTYVLGSDRADHGEDRGEKIMHNPEVLFGGHRDTILGKKSFDNGGGITAYQGGPHSVGEEGFLDEKIGTGEGAQSYGHGHYFAEAEPVAQGYRDRLGGHTPGAIKIGDEEHPYWSKKNVANAFKKLGYDPQTSVIAAHYINEHKGNLDKASAELWDNENISDSVHDALHKAEYATPAGHMHEVSINAHPDHMLDWDKTIDEQSDYVKNALNKTEWWPWTEERIEDRAGRHGSNPQGRHLYEDLVEDYSPEEASKFLQDSGIHGIRYLDASSRSKGEGTRNYVVFDPKRVDIKRRYEKGGEVLAHDDPRREENLAAFQEGNHPDVPHVLYHGTHGDIKQFKRTKGAHFGFHFGDVEAANNRLEDLADKHPWDSEDLKKRDKISTEHFNNLKTFEEILRRKNAEVPHDELVSALEKGEDIGPIFKKYEYVPTEQEVAQLANLHHVYKSSQFPIMRTGEGSNIGAYHVAIKNPLRMKDVGDWGSLKNIKSALPFDSNAKSHGELINELNSRGYDGVVYSNRVENPVMKTDSYIAFHPHQIKSATGNNGNFDPLKPNINEARGGRIGYDEGGDVARGVDNPGGAADANRPAGTSSYAEHNLNAGSGTQTNGPSSDNRPDSRPNDNRPDNSNDRFNIGGGGAPMPPQRGDDSFFGNMGGNIGSVLGGLAFGPLGSIGGRYLGNQFNQPDNSRFEAKNDEFGNPIGNSGGWLDFLGNSGNPPAPMTSDNRRDPIKRKRRILMPDGTYQEVEEGMKSGGVAKSYNRVHNSKIVEHALSKVGVSLHVHRPPS